MIKKVGILTFHRVYNYGATIQAYSLQKVINSMGYKAEIIDFCTPKQQDYLSVISVRNGVKRFLKTLLLIPRYGERVKRVDSFNEFFDNRLELSSRLYRSENELNEDAREYSAIIVGSDQVWNVNKSADRSSAYFLSFVDDAVKISYAPSLGNATVADLKPYEKLLSKIDYISCREKGGSMELSELLGKGVPVVLDPTLLVDYGSLDMLTMETKINNHKEYILYYSLDGYESRKRNLDILQYLGKILNAEILMVTPEWPYHNHPFIDIISAGPEEFLSLIKNALLVCTNSFHGTALSLCFSKPFFVLEKGDTKDERKRSLLNQLKLEERIISAVDQIDQDKILKIDYLNVNTQLDRFKAESRKFLVNALKYEKEN